MNVNGTPNLDPGELGAAQYDEFLRRQNPAPVRRKR